MNRKEMERLAGAGLTPAYVFDLDVLAERVRVIRDRLEGKAELCFAMKANSFLVRPLLPLVDKLEVCSPGEFRICERLQVPMERIVLSGVNKEEKEIQRVIETYQGQGTYTIESLAHLELLNRCASRCSRSVRVLLRISSGNQFGVDIKTAEKIIASRKEYPHLEFAGIQQYTGTQKQRFKKTLGELQALDKLLAHWKEAYGYEAEELEYGPGLFVPYFLEDEEKTGTGGLEELKAALGEMQFCGKVTLEMGRYLTADCGYFFTEVVDCKENFGEKYAIVDGGIHHINYFGQFMAMKQPYCTHIAKRTKAEGQQEEIWNICGSLCTSGDIIVKKFPFTNLGIHDILVFENLGAYSVTEAMYLFLSRDMPGIWFYSKEAGLVLVRDRIATHLWNGENITKEREEDENYGPDFRNFGRD